LVLDDFDKVKPSEFGTQQIFTAIDSRVQAGVPLIVTANLRLGEVVERYGEPIGSRLAGHCTQLVLDGPDRRLELG
jgi:DNA replication protein DnaC